jgi:hypothetical protein
MGGEDQSPEKVIGRMIALEGASARSRVKGVFHGRFLVLQGASRFPGSHRYDPCSVGVAADGQDDVNHVANS